ncbi:YdcF family protein [Acidobacteria bacterium AB60]|nr:YdcF family protein [Acidobacteria bacterium AB60]
MMLLQLGVHSKRGRVMSLSYFQPLLAAVILLLIAAVIWQWRRSGCRPTLLVLGVLSLFLVSWPPLASLMVGLLEDPYPVLSSPVDGAGAIVVLSSTVYPPYPPLPTSRLGSDSFERCQYAAWLHRNWGRRLPILASGGSNADEGTPPYAMVMTVALQREGVPLEMIWSETQSRSTRENALYSAQILRAKGIRKIVLVTEAFHMARAMRAFRKAGLEVVPAPCGYRRFHLITQERLLPSWEAIAWNEDLLHEALGLLWYHLRGWA